ncbi:MAG: F0F1 ATP synthase subunit A [Chloroflexi bacterium]|nr:F0F1 ATP synthase subunit A [Chloroflexota bacterium]
MSVHSPEVELPAEEIFTFGPFVIANSVIAAWITMLVLIALSWAATRKMKVIPTRLQSFFEFALGWVYDLCKEVAGEENGRRFFPFVVTIFLFVIMNAWLALLPGYGSISVVNTHGEEVHLLRPANTDINMPLAIAISSFVLVGYFGLKSRGIHFAGEYIRVGGLVSGLKLLFRGKIGAGFGKIFMGAIDAAIGLLEFLSVIVRMVSFTFRLFGNMTAGEILLLVVMSLAPYLVALPFYGLELLVGFVQALIFGGLTLVFLTLAVAFHEEEAA